MTSNTKNLENEIENLKKQLAEKDAELSLIKKKEYLLSAFASALPDPSFVLDENGTYLEAVTSESNLLFKESQLLVGKTIHDLLPKDVADGALAAIKKTLATNETQVFEYMLNVPAGLLWFEGRTSVYHQPGQKDSVVWLARDITARKNAEKELEKSNAFLNAIIESLPFDLWALDSSQRYILLNSTARKNWGKGTNSIGKTLEEISISDTEKKLWRQNNEKAFSGIVVTGETEYIINDETRNFYNIISPVYLKNSIIGITGVNIDITYHKRWYDEIQRNDRLEALGVLAGGIAHDFNNMLAGVLGNITLASMEYPERSIARHHLELSEKAIIDAKRLTTQLLTFAKGGEPLKKVINLSSVIKDTVEFSVSGSPVNLTIDIDPDIYPVLADSSQISQVLNNIVLNALHEMSNGGTLEVKAHNVNRKTLNGENSDFLCIIIKDSGKGIPSDIMGKIFDPYFTTKEQGSGLGLSVCHSIISRHNGIIDVESTPNVSTTFFVYLPHAKMEPEIQEPLREIYQFSATALVLEDNKEVLDIFTSFLKKLGIHVVGTTNEEEAVSLYKSAVERGGGFDICILDLTIGGNGGGGTECLKQLKEFDPAVKAIVTSGYSDNDALANYKDYGFCEMLEKPFSIYQLGAVLKKVL